MKLVKLTCPNCGAKLEVELQDGRTQLFCQYCGQKILLSPDYDVNININHNIHKEIHETYTDEAEVKKAEAELKREETNAKKVDQDLIDKYRRREINKKIIIALIIIITIGALLDFFSTVADNKGAWNGIGLTGLNMIIWGILFLIIVIEDMKKEK